MCSVESYWLLLDVVPDMSTAFRIEMSGAGAICQRGDLSLEDGRAQLDRPADATVDDGLRRLPRFEQCHRWWRAWAAWLSHRTDPGDELRHHGQHAGKPDGLRPVLQLP